MNTACLYLSEARSMVPPSTYPRLHSLRSFSLGLLRVSLRGCEVSIQRVVSDGCRVRPSWPSANIFLFKLLRTAPNPT